MRHFARRITVLLFLVLCLTGCSLVKSLESGLPLWYFGSKNPRNQVYFVGEGRASTQRQAELLAFTNITDKLSSYLGNQTARSAYRELSTDGTISDYGLTVIDRFVRTEDNGEVLVLIRSVADRTLLDVFRSAEAVDLGTRLDRIEALILKGDEEIKKGRDVTGLKYYLQSMVLSGKTDTRNLRKEYSFDTILEEVLYVLGNIELYVLDPKPEEPSCTVSVRRRGSFISSPVAECPVFTAFEAVDGRYRIYSDSYVFQTDSKGVFHFTTVNPNILASGKVTFMLGLSDEVRDVGEVSESAARRLREALLATNVNFIYQKKHAMGTIAVTSMEYSTLGDFIPDGNSTAYIAGLFEKDGAPAMQCPAQHNLKDPFLLDTARSMYPDAGVLFVSRSGITDTVYSDTGVVAVSMEGSVILYNMKDSSVIFSSGIVKATGFGSSYEEAFENGRNTISDIFYSLIKAVYV